MFKRGKSEIELIQASQQGDAQAFEIIVRQYQSLVCAITYSGTGCMDASEELAQETLLLAWKNLTQLREPGKFQAWLCRIARNTVQDWRRDRGRHRVGQSGSLASAGDQASGTAEPVDTVIHQEQAVVVSRALDQIPEKYREPLILYYREEKSVREVAGLLALTENTARQRITRARSMLKKKVSDMVETTLTHTRPGKAFTAAVMSSLVAGTLKTTATSATGFGIGALLKGLVSSVTVKLILGTTAAVIVTGGLWHHHQKETTALPQIENGVRVKNVSHLPAGKYAIAKASLIGRDEHIKQQEVSVYAGEHKNVNLEMNRGIGQYMGDGLLRVHIVDEQGIPLATPYVWLESSGHIIEPCVETDLEKTFMGESGQYTLHVEYPGFQTLDKPVTMKSRHDTSSGKFHKPVIIELKKRD